MPPRIKRGRECAQTMAGLPTSAGQGSADVGERNVRLAEANAPSSKVLRLPASEPLRLVSTLGCLNALALTGEPEPSGRASAEPARQRAASDAAAIRIRVTASIQIRFGNEPVLLKRRVPSGARRLPICRASLHHVPGRGRDPHELP